MKLQPDKSELPAISSYGPGWIAVDGERIAASVVIGSGGDRRPWHCASFAELGAEHFASLAEPGAELVLFGSGDRIRFPQPAWRAALMAQGIGVETMDTPAACRTYNILSADGRRVVLALLIDSASGAA